MSDETEAFNDFWEAVFDGLANSAACYAMIGEDDPDNKAKWEKVGSCWALSSPQKSPFGHSQNRKEAEKLQSQLIPISENARLFGWYVIGTKLLEGSRPSETFSAISAKLDSDATFKTQVEGIRAKAIEKNAKEAKI